MSEWKEYRLGEVAEITSSKRVYYSDYVESGIPFWRSKEVIERYNGKEITTELFISEEHYEYIKSKFSVPQQDDILLTSVGSLGIPYMVKNDERFYFKDGNLIWIRNIDASKLSPLYLFKWLGSDLGKNALREITIGSTQEALTIVGLKRLMLVLPALPEQKAIASVLSSLDDKIDLLHRQNVTLEKMAETIFRQWFIEKAKDDWEVVKLSDEFDFTMGVSPTGDTLNETSEGIAFYQGNADFGFRFPNSRVFTTSPKRFAEIFDTLISVRAPVGDINMACQRCCIGRGVAAFRYRNDESYFSYTYYKMKSVLSSIKQFNETGTVFGSITKKDFQEIDNLIPDFHIIENFQRLVNPLDKKIIDNSKQIQTLTALRDSLLPKLMSGEVKVNNERRKSEN